MAFPRGTESGGDSDARDAAAQIRRRRYSPPPSTLIDDMGFHRREGRRQAGDPELAHLSMNGDQT